MTLIYHGTSIDHAIEMALTGVMLSPLDKTISHLKNSKQYSGMRDWELEQKARELVELSYVDPVRELLRTNHIVFSDLDHEKPSCTKELPKVIFGLEFDDAQIESYRLASSALFYVPRTAKLDRLREVHVDTRVGARKHGLVVALEKYRPRFIDFRVSP